MFDPTIGRWTTPDPSGVQAADANLYLYAHNSPTNLPDVVGEGEERERTIDEGVIRGFQLNEFVVDKNKQKVHGRSFNTGKDDKQQVIFTFEKAYGGSWQALNIQNQKDKYPATGVFVKISAEAKGFDVNEIHFLQIVRLITFKGGKKKPVPANDYLDKDDENDPRYRLAGLDLPKDAKPELTRAQGWFVDVFSYMNKTAYWTKSVLGNPGNPEKKLKAEMWDLPNFPNKLKPRDIGMEFYTCAIGTKGGKATFLGALHWGFYIDDKGKVSFDDRLPVEASRKPPEELKPALARWNFYAEKLNRDPVNIGGL
jgi:hypothetical protein